MNWVEAGGEVEELLQEKGSVLERRAQWCASFEPPVQEISLLGLGCLWSSFRGVFSPAQASVWRVVC